MEKASKIDTRWEVRLPRLHLQALATQLKRKH